MSSAVEFSSEKNKINFLSNPNIEILPSHACLNLPPLPHLKYLLFCSHSSFPLSIMIIKINLHQHQYIIDFNWSQGWSLRPVEHDIEFIIWYLKLINVVIKDQFWNVPGFLRFTVYFDEDFRGTEGNLSSAFSAFLMNLIKSRPVCFYLSRTDSLMMT